ncbi:hypothetical protein MAR_032984 [Mya arenaria]|uniref:Integrase core domain-containing protein n=1 Tax=Mya arenaria TaxID=6604 RepID=A0ABY7G7P4_MYAAR|nr:hypothetical protein MAR_032984 [Mya arenaria]
MWLCFLLNELEHSGKQHGYKMMHLKCVQNGYCVTQETIRELLHIFYPNYIKHRQQRRLQKRVYLNLGPNYLWHIDGYDKLKPFGISIHGAIDGFSRYVLWLEAYKTNNDPDLIAGYYTETVNMMNGCPLRVGADMGTENCYVRDIHISSTQELSSHKTCNNISPSDRPLTFAQDYLCAVLRANVDLCLEECVLKSNITCDATVFEICTMIMDDHDLQMPDCGDSAVILYQTLRHKILSEISRT